ncbi:hypothetical protein HPB49_021762 [Dermacentor silvarum]|uniref:Uncharacterized protein n=2 Tax=Dermacentor silvarum TaxID=543639 RepID=A0ACB8CBF2_DERSI|nr:hypothetical protein HPB49_021762 [Dermacentor silvarum]
MPLPRQPDAMAARNSSPGREKELPSPQQPPPLTPGGLGLLSGPGPGQANHVTPDASTSSTSAMAAATTPAVAPTPIRKAPSSSGSTASTGSSLGKKMQRERKLLPCKDREYDPNKHCGVLIGDSGKPCTRSLTCKTHSLTLRRAVAGRRKNFDELLTEHRATKEAALNASKSAHPPSSSTTSSATDGVAASPAPSPLSSHHAGGPSSTNVAASSAGKHGCPGEALPGNRTSGGSGHLLVRAPSGGSKQTVLSRGSSTAAASSAGATAKQDQHTKSTPMDTTPATQASSQPASSSSASSGSTGRQRPDHSNDPYVLHHPRPAAVCTFGLRQMGNGLFLLDRRWDATRAALASALGTDGTQPPPLKRLCVVGSRLPNAAGSSYVSSNNEHQRSADPYSFGNVAVVETPVAVATSQTSVPHSLAAAVRSSPYPTNTSGGTASTQAVPTAIAAHPVSKATHPSKQAASSRSSASNGGSGGSNVLLSSAPRKKKPVSSTITAVVTSSAPSVASSLATSMATGVPVSSVASAVQVPLSGTPVTFPFRTHLGALSRLQVSGQSVAPKDGGTAMLVTTTDVLNGQVNSSGLLHSVTISKPAVATTLLQCRPVDEKATKPSAGPTLLKARKPNPPASGRTSAPVIKNHHQPPISQGLALPELLAAPQVPVPAASQLPNGMPTVLGQSKLFSVPNHSVQGVLDGNTYHQAQLVAKGARNGSRSHPGRAVLPDTASSVMTGSTATSLPASMAKQQLYQQVLAGQVQAQLVPAALKLPLLLPNDERRHRPQQPHLKVPGGSLPT